MKADLTHARAWTGRPRTLAPVKQLLWGDTASDIQCTAHARQLLRQSGVQGMTRSASMEQSCPDLKIWVQPDR